MGAVLVLGLGLSVVARAAPTAHCPQHFAGGQAPLLENSKLKARTQALCYEAFAVLHSGISRTPLYAAEHLYSQRLAQAKSLSRKDSFHAEDALPTADRAELGDYARSGYDRGHMAPNADMPTRSAQAESFSLANMVPQVHENNAGIWSGIESAARQLATEEGELYVVSGPAFIGEAQKRIGRVLVPTHLWKVFYSPKQQRAAAYWVSNEKTRDYAVLSIAELQKLIGIDPLPGLPAAARDNGLSLPKPVSARAGSKGKKASEPEEEFNLRDLSSLLNHVLQSIIGR